MHITGFPDFEFSFDFIWSILLVGEYSVHSLHIGFSVKIVAEFYFLMLEV
jgi:hypothetical protein